MLNQLTVLNLDAYKALRYTILLNVEESGVPKASPYSDSKGIPTIGIRFNLQNALVRNRVLSALGFDIAATAGTAEKGYINEAIAVVNKTYLTGTQAQRNDLIQKALDGIMARRAADTGVIVSPGETKRPAFTFNSDT